jgi:DNA-directed RNA polymerase III subunit RPC1
LKPNNIETVGQSLIVIRPDSTKHGHALNAELQRLLFSIPNVVIAGLTNVSRAVIAVEDNHNPPTFKLCVEGSGLRDVMATYGIIGKKTKSNNILEVYATLGERPK